MAHNDRYDTQSISLSDVNGYYAASRDYPIEGFDTMSQSVYQPQGQSYPQSGGEYYLVNDTPAYYPTTTPGYSGQIGVDDGYAGSFATSSVISAPVSDGWDVQSSAVASSIASTAPPRYNGNNVDSRIITQPTATQRYELPCEIRGCAIVYHGDETDEWIRHTEAHLGGTFPSKLRCWFNCPFNTFDASRPEFGGNNRNTFEHRMRHIRDHIIHDGFRPEQRIDDGFLIEHLRKQGMIDDQGRNAWLRPSRLPPIVSSGRAGSETRSGHEGVSSRNHQRNGHTYLAMVVEENEAGPSSSRGRRHEKKSEKKSEKKEHKRDSHNKRKSTK